jgi:hypothetical protein
MNEWLLSGTELGSSHFSCTTSSIWDMPLIRWTARFLARMAQYELAGR